MKPRFLLFKASAGSGKTYQLAIQYIALLVVNGEHEFRRTLAVTFTNKATAEMKDRILEFLYDIWQKRPNSDGKLSDVRNIASELYNVKISDEEIRNRCHLALRAILHDYSRFYVSTIDAFFQSVLRGMAHELGLNARLQVDLNDKTLIELAVDNLIDSLRHDNRDVLPWLTQYIEQQLNEGNSWDVRGELKRIATLLFQEEYLKRSLDERNRPFNLENIGHFRQFLRIEREQLIKPVQREADKFENILRNLGLDYEELFNYQADIHKYIDNMKQGYVDVSFSNRLASMVTDWQKMLRAPLRKETSLHPIIQQLAEQLNHVHEQHERAARRIGSIDLALANLTPMGLLGAIDAEVTRLSNERNRFILARTPITLRSMIQGDDASFVFERIGTQYHNIMIDEFQDTSRLQWENFRTLLVDNLASGGLSMIVGDIKQSIYRWRNGDWRILHELDVKGYHGIPLIQKPLNDNYRSAGNIVRFNNWLFPLVAQSLDHLSINESHQLANLYKDVEQGIKREAESGYIRIRLLHSKDKEKVTAWETMMLDDVCQQVSRLHTAGVPYCEMAILLRKNKYIQPTIEHFAKQMSEVHLVSNEAFLLGSSIGVQMIICALQVVDDIERDPVALYYLVQHYYCDVLQHDETSRIAPSDTEQYLEALPESFSQHLEELRTMPLYELCEHLYSLLDIEKIVDRQDAYLFTFFDELSNYLRDNPTDIPTFIQYWNEQMQNVPIPNGEVDGIRIYTIHKSKGLAFHTVLMPFADWAIERDMMDDMQWCMPKEEPINEMGSLPIRLSSKKVQGTAFEADYLEEHANRRADELNALYVAFTRPKANLLVWGLSQNGMTNGKQDENVADLLYEVLKETNENESENEKEEKEEIVYEVGAPVATENKLETEYHAPITIPMQSYNGKLSFRQSSEASDFISRTNEDNTDETQLSYINKGKLMHYVFSQIETADDIDSVTKRLAQQGILKSDNQLIEVRKFAQRGLHHPQVKDWLSGKYQLYNECNILIPDPDNEGKLLKKRPDRVMISDNKIIVVDFKFGRPDEEYHKQVQQYMDILHSMYPQREIEGWLWYVYSNIVESVKFRA